MGLIYRSFYKRYLLVRRVLSLFKQSFPEVEKGLDYFVSVSDAELFYKSPRAETKMLWSSGISLLEVPGYSFLGVAPNFALTIPHAKVTSGDLEPFLAVVRGKCGSME